MTDAQLYAEVRRAISERLMGAEIPILLAEIYKRGIWKEITVPNRGAVRYGNFATFMVEDLRLDIAVVLRMARTVPRTEAVLIRALRDAPGGDQRSAAAADTTKVNNVILDRLDQGNSRGNALKRLQTQRPDLHRAVLAGHLTPHAAMIEAGFRPRSFSVPDDPARALAILIRRYGRETIVRLLESTPSSEER